MEEEGGSALELELESTYIDTESGMDQVAGPTADPSAARIWPLINMEGNQWLEKAFEHKGRVTKTEIHAAFQHPAIKHSGWRSSGLALEDAVEVCAT